MSEESRRIYNLLSSSFLGNNSRISDQEMESLRSDYLKLIEENDWMEQLLLISHNLQESIREKMFLLPVESVTNLTLFVSLGTNISELSPSLPFTVGRNPGCHLGSASNLSLSRLHVVIFPMPEYGKVIICDIGSLCGITMKKRSSNQPCVSSFPNDRNIIVIEYGETALFELGTYELMVSPFSQDNGQIYHYKETQDIFKTRKRSNVMMRG